ncbi:MAG: DUF4469 domain-containing protein [Bacteroides sp.]|nr:DUF4469 domain-containing protein [Prevotella sp.]MCM1407530.1 DUF4469 domain-containing protein [Treponema brennaborense]MCM1470020.1 DUF4469 domain-containing protein [Bacteroides sp.]
MNDKSNNLTEKVNVTMRTVFLREKDVAYAKVQRNTAYIGNIIDKVLEKSKVLDRETLLYAAGMLRNGVVDLLKAGKSVDILELGVMYLKPRGGMASENPGIDDVPNMKLAFTPSELALAAVKDVSVAADITGSNDPVINEVFDLRTRSSGTELSAGQSVRVRGSRLKVAGDGEETGVFLVPCLEGEPSESDSAKWIHIAESDLIDNTSSVLMFNVPADTAGTFKLVVKTAYGSGNRVNKTVRTGTFDKILSIA